jgi:hypothetical protein
MSSFVGPAPGSYAHFVAITKSDTTIYSPPLTQIYCGGTGDVAVLGVADTVPVVFSAVPVGATLTGIFQKVMSTGTTATLLIGAN